MDEAFDTLITDSISDGNHVTSSELVRHFGLWQERAGRAPVYILHRGRPRYVLTSVDVMNALCAPHAAGARIGPIDPVALLDRIGEIVLVADDAFRIVAASAAARTYFGDPVSPGGAMTAIVPEETRPLLIEALVRVLASGTTETIDLPASPRPDRDLSIAIAPHAGGIAVFAHDRTIEEERRDALAERRAIADSLATVPGAAHFRINLRGYLEGPAASLASLAGLLAESLVAVRFVTLVEIASRVAVADAIEAVIGDGAARHVEAVLLVNRGAALPVSIGLAPLRRGLAIAAVAASIVTCAAPTG